MEANIPYVNGMRKDTHITRIKNKKTFRIFGRAIFERDIRGSWILSQGRGLGGRDCEYGAFGVCKCGEITPINDRK